MTDIHLFGNGPAHGPKRKNQRAIDEHSPHGLKIMGCLLGLALCHELEGAPRCCILFGNNYGRSPRMAKEDARPQQGTLPHRQIQVL